MFGFFKKKKAPEQVSDMSCVLAIADCISHSNPAVHADLEQCLNEPAAYAVRFAERFEERGIDAAACDADTLCWIAMVDELEAVHDLIGVDGSSELEDFLWAVSQLNGGGKPDFFRTGLVGGRGRVPMVCRLQCVSPATGHAALRRGH